MRHHANPGFWEAYDKLPPKIHRLARKNFALLRRDAYHPSLHFKRVGRYWTVRVGIDFRAVAIREGDDLVWFWIGPHDEYDVLTR